MKKSKSTPLNGKREISTFLEAIGKTPRIWKSLDIRIAAIKIGRNWHNVYTCITLLDKSMENIKKRKRINVLNSFSIWFGTLPESQLNKILQQIRLGELAADITGKKIYYQKWQNELKKPNCLYNLGYSISIKKSKFAVCALERTHIINIWGSILASPSRYQSEGG